MSVCLLIDAVYELLIFNYIFSHRPVVCCRVNRVIEEFSDHSHLVLLHHQVLVALLVPLSVDVWGPLHKEGVEVVNPAKTKQQHLVIEKMPQSFLLRVACDILAYCQVENMNDSLPHYTENNCRTVKSVETCLCISLDCWKCFECSSHINKEKGKQHQCQVSFHSTLKLFRFSLGYKWFAPPSWPFLQSSCSSSASGPAYCSIDPPHPLSPFFLSHRFYLCCLQASVCVAATYFYHENYLLLHAQQTNNKNNKHKQPRYDYVKYCNYPEICPNKCSLDRNVG